MHFSVVTVLLPLLAATPLASAWKLQVFMNDGRSVTTHGRLDSGCKTYDFDMSSPVKRVKFENSLVTKSFELYTKRGCQGAVSYRNNEGTYDLTPPRKILSYKAY
ncbi:uncharacterized protein M421DRAFT_358219 [Didymella exigua CBS 183.55]|uniref:Uncharacterized protein n=1 Tax=Didymella exigua CBS 183.55 TaxID=1150837 RepID=A0A6A5RZS1_9PLEO|nr:uncharacterized protein M421DRAFT_358219 [Didymella exigua CBS 183.55]KAF1930757.1 hypothetical protein M421DRAFT_358219 [Didymella exigua CBS 183.55]